MIGKNSVVKLKVTIVVDVLYILHMWMWYGIKALLARVLENQISN